MRSVHGAAGLLLVLAPVAAAALEVPLGRAPGGQPQIEVRTARGQPVTCLFDTGATRSVLAPTLPDPARDRRLADIAATGAGGTGWFTSWQMRHWRLGERTLPDFPALITDLGTSTPCVLGPDVLGANRIELDLVDYRLRVLAAPATASSGLRYDSVQGFLRLRLPFPGGGEGLWILDTGAGTTVINRQAAERLGLDPQRPANWVERRGLDGRTRRHRVHAIRALELLPGGAALDRVEVAELPVLATLGIFADNPGGLLGSDVLQGRRVLIDLERKQLEFRP